MFILRGGLRGQRALQHGDRARVHGNWFALRTSPRSKSITRQFLLGLTGRNWDEFGLAPGSTLSKVWRARLRAYLPQMAGFSGLLLRLLIPEFE
jgi:hypothetical protein